MPPGLTPAEQAELNALESELSGGLTPEEEAELAALDSELGTAVEQGVLEVSDLNGGTPETTKGTGTVSKLLNLITQQGLFPEMGQVSGEFPQTTQAQEQQISNVGKQALGLGGESTAGALAGFAASKVPVVGPLLAPLATVTADQAAQELNKLIGLREEDPNRDPVQDFKTSLALGYGLYFAPALFKKGDEVFGVSDSLKNAAKKIRVNTLGVKAKDRLATLGAENLDKFDESYEIVQKQGLFNNPIKTIGSFRKKILDKIDDRVADLDPLIKEANKGASVAEVEDLALNSLDKVDEWIQTLPKDLRSTADNVLDGAIKTLGESPASLTRVNDLKRSYWKYSRFKGSPEIDPVANETRKRIGNAFKETVEAVADSAIPNRAGDVRELNAQIGAFYDFERTTSDVVAKSKTKDFVSWLQGHVDLHNKATQAGAAVGFATKNPILGLAAREATDALSSTPGRMGIASAFQGAGDAISGGLDLATNPATQSIALQVAQEVAKPKSPEDAQAEALSKIPPGSIPGDIQAFEAEKFNDLIQILPLSNETKQALEGARAGTENEKIVALGQAKFELRKSGLFAPSPVPGFSSFVATPNSKSSTGEDRIGVIVAEPERDAFSQQLRKMKDGLKRAKLRSEFNADGSVLEIPSAATEKEPPIKKNNKKVDSVDSAGEARVADAF